MHTSVCVSVKVKYTTQMSTVVSLICVGPSFQKMNHHFLLFGLLGPINLEKNLKPCCFICDLVPVWRNNGSISVLSIYSEACLKWLLKNRQNKRKDNWYLSAFKKYCRFWGVF